jgi:hypothetical protein
LEADHRHLEYGSLSVIRPLPKLEGDSGASLLD